MTELARIEPIETTEQPKPLKYQKIIDLTGTLTYRRYEESDYATAHEWWTEKGRGHLARTVLSPLGIVIEQRGKPIAMGWIYFSSSNMAQVGWVIANPTAGPKTKIAALMKLFVMAEMIIEKAGFKYIQMMSDNPVLSKVAKALGWGKLVPHDFMMRVLVEDDNDV